MATNRPRALQVYDPVLSNLARRYVSAGFIARQLIPSIPVQTLSGQYPVFTKSYWFQNLADNQVTDRAPAKEVDFTWSLDQYLAREFALKVSITDLERAQAIPQLRLEQSKTELLTQQMELAYEMRAAQKLMLTTDVGSLETGGITAANTHGGTAWDGAGTPETDLKTASIATYRLTGRRPNVVIIPFEVAYALAVNAAFRALLRYDATGAPQNFLTVGDRVLPSVIHGMKVIIPEGAQVDSSGEGNATASVTEIWGKHVRCLWIDPNAAWGMPSVMYRMEHTPKRVTKWSVIDPDIDYVRELERFDLKVVAPDLGYVIKNVIS